jgi:uncharacterized membrane protein
VVKVDLFMLFSLSFARETASIFFLIFSFCYGPQVLDSPVNDLILSSWTYSMFLTCNFYWPQRANKQ